MPSATCAIFPLTCQEALELSVILEPKQRYSGLLQFYFVSIGIPYVTLSLN
jgi:hypothetical protein